MARTLCLVSILCTAFGVDAHANVPGNAWHVPHVSQEGIASMRAPLRPSANSGLTLYTGNQFKGEGGNPGNQLGDGSFVHHRDGTGAWQKTPLAFHSEAGNNKYFVATLPASTAGHLLEYYFEIPYSDHPTTFVYSQGMGSSVTTNPDVAKNAPFAVTVRWPLTAKGAYDEIKRGSYSGRVYKDSGHVELRQGEKVIATVLPEVLLAGRWQNIGATKGTISLESGALRLEQSVGGRSISSELRIYEGRADYRVLSWGGGKPEHIELSKEASEGEQFYGLGEKFNSVDQAGKRVRILGVDAPGNKGDLSYKSVPWFLSSKGHGFSLGTDVESYFDFGLAEPGRVSVEYDGTDLSFSLYAGPTMAEALARYTAHAGRPPTPPIWTFEPWLSSDHWRDGGEVRYVVTRYRELGLAGSVFVFDSPWETSYNDFQWNVEQFRNGGTYEGTHWDGFESPQAMMEFLDAHGFKVVLWITPFLNVESVNENVPGQNTGKSTLYDEAASKGYLVKDGPQGQPVLVSWWKGTGSPIDFTNPDAVEWFQEKLRALVVESGGIVAGFKTDDGEGNFVPDHGSYFDGRTGRDMKNQYSVLYQRAAWEVLGSDGVLLSRSGGTGSQAFPVHWSGDNEPNYGQENGLRSVVTAGITAGLSGFSIWGHDVGGYLLRNPSSTPGDLFMRWTQFGALSPVMQVHRQVDGTHQYPWGEGEAALENYRRYAQLHSDLAPLFHALAKEAELKGLPILRHPGLVFPGMTAEKQYLLGETLFVAPIVDNMATTKQVHLPPGVWLDFFSHERRTGSFEWASKDPMRMPLFIRSGSVVPMRDGETVAMRIYPDENGARTRRLADGTEIAVARSANQVEVSVSGPAQTLKLSLFGGESLVPSGATPVSGEQGFVHAVLQHTGGTTVVLFGPPRVGEEMPTETAASGGCGQSSSTSVLFLLLLGIAVRRRFG